MEIEEMQALWSDMSNQLEHQKKLTNKIIMDMTQERYSNKFRTIATMETIGAIFCSVIGIVILANFSKLDTWYLMLCGAITVAFILGLPVLALRALRKIRTINITNKNYKEALLEFSNAKKHLMNIQKGAVVASFIVMIAASGVGAKLLGNKDFFLIERNIWANLSILLAIVFVSFTSYWGYRSYSKLTNSAENILKDLD